MREDLLPTTLEGKVAKYIEEIGETLHPIGKFQRHGATPTDPKTGITYDNLADLKRELPHVIDAANALLDCLYERESIEADKDGR